MTHLTCFEAFVESIQEFRCFGHTNEQKELVMDAKMEKARPVVHISIETYLNHIAQGKFPARLLDSRPLDDFEHNGYKYIVDLEPPDEGFLYPEGDFEQILSSNPVYIKKLMNRFSMAVINFLDAFNRVVEGDIGLLEDRRTILQQAYLFKINSRSELPSSIHHNLKKATFYRDFCHQVAQAFIAGRSAEDFKQFAATRPKNVNRMRGMVTFLSLDCHSKRQLYRHFINEQEYIKAHSLTLLPEADLQIQLLASLVATYNEAISEMHTYPGKRSPREKLTSFDLKLFSSSKSHSDTFEPLELSSKMTVDEVLKHTVQLLKNLNNSLKDKQTKGVMSAFRKNIFYAKTMGDALTPGELLDKIQDYLSQHQQVEISSHRSIS